ncbi:hypothetical protein B1C78_05000 [Thioalkalivibrio denitrificans]|uniref:Uncharacterized protein n=1 Tax=Thioalkalivibrio denitrificans TaxID=108003 RepID=A0A1V3NMX0_9GAMM|nr:hypothetical protein [Thioalkalivibrio denitrificans]OOG26425.1 hypothetical protein B1C78_05000 [Thioalkalivibrio denitrificans]
MIKRFLLLCLFLGAMSVFSAHSGDTDIGAESWPPTSCSDDDYWMFFAELALCVSKADVLRVEHLNLSDPSISITMRVNERALEVGLLWFEKSAAVAGIHDYLDVAPEEVFSVLTGELPHEHRNVVEEILYVNDKTRITVYEGKGIIAYALIRPVAEHSSIYVFRPEQEGVIKVTGPLESEDVEILLSFIRW